MAKTQAISFNDFMTGDYKTRERAKKHRKRKGALKVASSAILPIATGGTVGTIGLIAATGRMVAQNNAPEAIPAAATAVPVGAGEWMGEKAAHGLAHILDPIIDILVSLSLPVASVVIVGGCFYFIFGNTEKAWGLIQNAALGYILIQASPLFIEILKSVGKSI